MIKSLTLSAIVFITYTEMDIHAQPFWTKFDAYAEYYLVWQIALWGMLILLGVTTKNPFIPFILLLNTVNGAEDLFYFLFQLQFPPERLPWLYGKIYAGIPYTWELPISKYWYIFQNVTAPILWLNALWGFALLILFSRIKVPFRKFNR